MPACAARVNWCRALAGRLRPSLEAAERLLGGVMASDGGKEVRKGFAALLAQLQEMEETRLAAWREGADMRLGERLKLPLLARGEEGRTVRVNLDGGIWALLREARYLA